MPGSGAWMEDRWGKKGPWPPDAVGCPLVLCKYPGEETQEVLKWIMEGRPIPDFRFGQPCSSAFLLSDHMARRVYPRRELNQKEKEALRMTRQMIVQAGV